MDFRGVSQPISKKGPCENFTLNLINAQNNTETQQWVQIKEAIKPIPYLYDIELHSKEIMDLKYYIPNIPNNMVIKKAVRIQDPYRMAEYLLRKEQLKEISSSVDLRLKCVSKHNNYKNQRETNFHLQTLFLLNCFDSTEALKSDTEKFDKDSVIILCHVLYVNYNIDKFCIYPSYIIFFDEISLALSLSLDIINLNKQEELVYWNLIKSREILLHEVKLDSNEGKFVIANMSKGNIYTVFVNKIQRVENPYLMAAYLLNKEKNIREYGKNVVQTRLLMHGTKKINVDGIIKYNFDVRVSKRSLFGKGVYFTNNVGYAQHFSDYAFSKKVLIVAYVLVSRTCEGNEKMDIPNNKCDTSLNTHTTINDVIVKYDDDTFYPAYIVDYAFSYKKIK